MIKLPTTDRNSSEAPNPEEKTRRRRVILGAVMIAVLVGAILGGILGGNKIEIDPLPENGGTPEDECPPDLNAKDTDVPSDRFLQEEGDFLHAGCFLQQSSPDTFPLPEESTTDQAKACSQKCLTRHFGVTVDTCLCYVDPPQERLAIGSCSSVCGTPVEERMEVYFNTKVNTECNQEASSSVRNFLVQEDDAPFGYDLIRNTYCPSIFQLFADECGTNIYEIQTEASEDSNKLSTNVQGVEEFASGRRSHLSSSISTSASASYKGLFFEASVKASAAMDMEQNALLKASRASSTTSRVFTSTGVRRLVEVKLVDFDNRRHFVTLNEQFAALLRDYRDSGYNDTKAEEIVLKYGHLVIERGIFGGYLQLRSTIDASTFEFLGASEEDMRQCYEASMSAKASGFSFSGSFEVGANGCTEEAAKEMQRQQKAFETETSATSVVGGTRQGDEFVVTYESSTLLTARDKYPANDNGIQLRLLTDFLAPDKISPLEARQYQITEEDFGIIQTKLEGYILKSVQAIGAALDACDLCPLSYLEAAEDGSLACQCFGQWTDYMNDFDGLLSFSRGSSGQKEAICGMSSFHDIHFYDRKFRFKTCQFPEGPAVSIQTQDSEYPEEWGLPSLAECPNSSFVSSVDSTHNNYWKDRKFKYTCDSWEGYATTTCNWSEYVNDWFEPFDFECGENQVFGGIESYYSGFSSSSQDRRFRFQCCHIVPQA